MNLLEGLKLIRSQVAVKEEWFQGAMFSEDGKQRCLLNRINAVNNHDYDLSRDIAICVHKQLEKMEYQDQISKYNDTHSHEDVLNLLDKVIEQQEKEV